MTIPTLLGSGGHGLDDTQSYDTGDYYGNIGLGRSPMKSSPFRMESQVSQVFRVPGTISYLSWGLEYTTFPSALTLAVNKGASASSLVISIPAYTSGWVTDSTHSVNVSGGDALDFSAHLSSGESGNTNDFYCISVRFDATTDSAQLLTAVGASGQFTPTTSLQFFNFLGVLGAPGAEGDKQFKCLADGTRQNMACYVESNTFNRVTVVHNRINSASGSMFLSVLASTSGFFEDTSHSDTLSAGDLLAYGVNSVLSGSGEIEVDWIGAHFLASTTSNSMIGGSAGMPIEIDLVPIYYSSLSGAGNLEETDPYRATGLMPYACTASNYTNYITDAHVNGAATFTLLKGGVASGLAITSSPGVSGYFTASGSVDFALNETCANRASLAAGTRVEWASAGLLLQASP